MVLKPFPAGRANMFVWSAIFCLAAASGALGLPGAIGPKATSQDTEPGVNASKTIDVSGIKTRIRLLLEQTLDIDDKKAVSNSTTLHVRVDKRDVKCNASKSQCDCSSGQCDCSKGQCSCSKGQCSCSNGQCSCPTGCQDKKPASEEIVSTTEQPTGVRIEREADQKDEATTKRTPDDNDDDDDEEEPKIKKPQESDSAPEEILGGYEGLPTRKSDLKGKTKLDGLREYEDGEDEPKNISDSQGRNIPAAMLQRERQLYVRSLSETDSKEGHEDVAKREVPPVMVADWVDELMELRWADEKPAYRDWDFLYPKMNQVRLAREAAEVGKLDATSVENGTPGSLSKSGDSPQTKQEPTVAKDSAGSNAKSEDVVIIEDLKKSSMIKRSVESEVPSADEDKDSGSHVRVKRNTEQATNKEETEVPATDEHLEMVEAVTGVSKTSEPEQPSTGDPKDASSKREGASVAKQVRELPKEDQPTESNKPKDVTPKVDSTPIKGENPPQDDDTEKAPISTLQGSKGQEKQEAAPTVAETKGLETKNRLKSGLESAWGSDTHDSEKWQKERRLGDARSVPSDFDNLDIRYLGGNDLHIPPVDITNFRPEDVTGQDSADSKRPASHVPVDRIRSASELNMASCGILMMALALVTALEV